MSVSRRRPRRLLGLALLAAVVVSLWSLGSGIAAAQEDPFVTSGPDQLGERVSESEQATDRLNQAVYGLLGLAALVTVGTVVFWRMSAPSVERVREVQPAFRIEYKSPAEPPTGPPVGPSVVPPSGQSASLAVPTVAAISVEQDSNRGAWASQGWGFEDGA